MKNHDNIFYPEISNPTLVVSRTMWKDFQRILEKLCPNDVKKVWVYFRRTKQNTESNKDVTSEGKIWVQGKYRTAGEKPYWRNVCFSIQEKHSTFRLEVKWEAWLIE